MTYPDVVAEATHRLGTGCGRRGRDELARRRLRVDVQDFSVGCLDHTSTSVLVYLQETFTFRVLTPQASVPLTYPAADVKSA